MELINYQLLVLFLIVIAILYSVWKYYKTEKYSYVYIPRDSGTTTINDPDFVNSVGMDFNFAT